MKSSFIRMWAVLCFLLALGTWAQAQTLDLEKTYTISSKAKRGALAKVDFDANTGQYTLIYVTKSNDKMTRFQTYVFDRDFNLVDSREEEIEKEKARTKYKWFSFKGEEYAVEGIAVEPNLFGTLILKQKRITYKYDWLLLGYYKSVDVLKKVKPRTEDGRVLFYLNHAEDDKTGEVYVLCGVKDKIGKNADPSRHFKDLYVLKYNAELDLVKEVSIKFDHPQNVAFARSLEKVYDDDPENPGVAGLALVFAPMGGQGFGKYEDPEKTNYTYVRIDDQLNVVDRIAFTSQAAYWKIDELVLNTVNDAVYLFGPSAAGKDKYYNALVNTTKFKAVQLMRIANHKVSYLTETDLPEFESKLKTPPGQRKAPNYEGKKFSIANYHIAQNGDFFVVGQNFSTSKTGNKYDDVLAFHFDKDGKLKAQYGVDTKESNQFSKAAGTPQFFVEKGDKLYWFLQEIKGVYGSSNKVLSYPRSGVVGLPDASVSEFKTFGKDDNYYLDPKYPYLQSSDSDKLVFFGSDKKGKEIWFLRLKLD